MIEMVADFQDPVDMIPKYVKAWEIWIYKIVIGIKTSKESRVMYALRLCITRPLKSCQMWSRLNILPVQDCMTGILLRFCEFKRSYAFSSGNCGGAGI